MPRASQSLGARLALWAIRRYQRHLSPHKGFSCALRVTTGGASCSAYGHRAIARHGLMVGLQLLDRRLARCGRAHRALHTPAPAVNPVLHYQRGECDPGCDCDLPSPGKCLSGACNVLDGCSCNCDLPDKCDRDRWRRWRERRWLAKAARRQREQAERDARARRERELRERQDRNSRH